MTRNETGQGPESRRLEALASIAGSLAHCADLDTVLSVGLDATLRALETELGGIYLLDEDNGDLRLTAHYRGVPPGYAESVARFARGESLMGQALEGDVPVVVRDLSSMPEARDATRELGIRSCVLLPLYARGRAVGVLVAGGFALRDFAPDDLMVLEAIGGVLGGAIETSRLLARTQRRDAAGRRASQLYLVSAAAEIATSTLDVSALLGAIARHVQRSFEYPSVGVYLADPAAREAVLAGTAGAIEMPRGHRLRFGDGVVGWAAEHGEHVLVRDARREPRFQSAAPDHALSALAVPVRLAGEVVAVIAAESDQPEAFDGGDVIALDAIAAQVASGIRNARLFEEKVRALRSLEILQEITNVLNSDLDLDALLLRIARRSVEAVKPARMGSVLLYDGDALSVRSSFGYPRPEALARVRLAFHEGLPGSVFVSGHGRWVASSPSDWGGAAVAFREATGEQQPTSALCVPVSLPEQKLGVLLLENFASSEAFGDEDLRFAATLADQAAIAIGNALHLRKILELDVHRQNYLSNVSHELRTPLTVIQGYVEALISGIPGDPKHFLGIVQEQCQRLGRMIEEVLEVSRLEQGIAQRHIEWGPVAFSSIVRKVVQGLRQEVLLKDLSLREDLDDGLPPIPGDERLLHLLVSNLIENAVKFTPKGGGVEVGLCAEDGSLVLTVRDDGIGIPDEHQDRIFDKFFTVSDGASRTHGGAGIGLYLAREVAAIHDGRIRVESAEGRGALFEVRLPVRPSR